MPAKRSAKRNLDAGSAATDQLSVALSEKVPLAVEPCYICGVQVSRRSDIPRHMKRHDRNAKKFLCPWPGCKYGTLQKSNLETHYRRHTNDKPYVCTHSDDCSFSTCDPASLLKHRKRYHGYIPSGNNISSSPISVLPSSSSGILQSSTGIDFSSQWDMSIQTLSDITDSDLDNLLDSLDYMLCHDYYLDFCADMERLDQQVPSPHYYYYYY